MVKIDFLSERIGQGRGYSGAPERCSDKLTKSMFFREIVFDLPRWSFWSKSVKVLDSLAKTNDRNRYFHDWCSLQQRECQCS